MRDISENLLSKLSRAAGTFCYCWQIILQDGAIIGFTTHDEDIQVDDILYLGAPSLNAPVFDQNLGMNVDSFEALGVIDHAIITQEDLRAGRYHDAKVILTLRDWSEPNEEVELMRGQISFIQESKNGFQVEIRQITDQLSQKQGRFYSAMCDTHLGSERCGINLNNSLFMAEGVIKTQIDALTIEIDNITGFESGFFSFGMLTFQNSAYKAQSFPIRGHEVNGGFTRISFWMPLPLPVEIGASVTLSAGCDKSFQTCKEKFSNQINFQGFPLIPGVRYATS